MKNTFVDREIIPANEQDRLKAMHRYQLLDGLPQGYFTGLANIMAETFDASIALVSLVSEEQVLFAGNVGMEDTVEVPRGISLCSLAVLDENPTIFPDALNEPCLLSNPLVTGEFGLRFYAGAPILTKDGYALGTVCIVGKEPREFSEREQELLQGFAATAMEEIEMRQMILR